MAFKGYFVHHQYCSDVTLLFLIGGILILEAQSFSGYRKKKRLTERIFENFQNIKLRPEGFSDYLLHEVGFESGTMIAVPNHSSQGFQRPLQVNLLLGNTIETICPACISRVSHFFLLLSDIQQAAELQ